MAIANLRPQLLEVETTLQHCADQLVGTLMRGVARTGIRREVR
jgi:hypothetical protein